MKRVFCLIMAFVLVLCTIGACAEAENFSVRNGITYHMTPTEVVNKEKENGNTPFDKNATLQEQYKYGLEYSHLSVAGVEDSVIEYRFEKDGLYFIEYKLHNGSYNSLADALTKKYGNPMFSTSDKTTFARRECSGDIIEYAADGRSNSTFSNGKYKEWIVPYTDCYAVITLTSVKLSGRVALSWGTDYSICLFYSLYSIDEMNSMIDEYQDKVNSENAALIEMQKRHEQELENDL